MLIFRGYRSVTSTYLFVCGDGRSMVLFRLISASTRTWPTIILPTPQVAFLEGSDVYLAASLAFLRVHETGPAHYCIGTMMAHLDLCQSGMYDVDILLHQVKMS